MKAYLGFALLVFIIATISGIYELYYFVYFSLGLCGILLFFTRKAAENFEIQRKVEKDRIFYGERSEVVLSLTNNSYYPIFWFGYREQVPIKLRPPLQPEVVSFLPGESRTITYNLQGQRRGYYQLGPFKATLGDGLGFIETQLKAETAQPFIVYPQVHNLAELGLPSRIAFGDIIWPQKIYRDPTEFRGLREYEHGDQLKDIYWPATANKGELMVKEYESTVAVENMIFLNLHKDDYEVKTADQQIELAVEAAASVANYLIHCNQTVGLVSNGVDPYKQVEFIEPGQGIAQLLEIMEYLARVEMTEEKTFSSLIEQYNFQLPPGSTLLWITKIDSDKLIKRALKLCREGLNIVIIVMGAKVIHSEYLNRPYTENLVIYKLNRERDIYSCY